MGEQINQEHIRQASVEKAKKFSEELANVVFAYTSTSASHLNEMEKIMAVTFVADEIAKRNKENLGEDVLKMIANAEHENEKRKETNDGDKSC
ncbi:hypothetical protein UT300009_30380 [Paraclostridium bifermentans]